MAKSMTMKTKVEDLRVGDIVMPPPLEVRLWMRRNAAERNLPLGALCLIITQIDEVARDKRGHWLLFTCRHTPAWYGVRKQYPFRFRARPGTPWETIATGVVAPPS